MPHMHDPPSYDEVASALSYISPEDRETWVRMAMAVKSALWDDGWSVWDAWSQGSDRYKARDARAVWRSVRAHGAVGVGSLFAEAKRNGWTGRTRARVAPPRPSAPPPREDSRPTPEQAARTARTMLAEAALATHPYLERKGFPDTRMLVREGALLVPMRPVDNYSQVASLQAIRPDGSKKFLWGGRAGGCVYHLGSGREQWWCEGLATGLSVQAALKRLYRRACVSVCFSAHNLSRVARRGIVVADHDAKSGAGEAAARRTGLPFWLPPEPGDANDFHQEHGLDALAEQFRRVLVRSRRAA